MRLAKFHKLAFLFYLSIGSPQKINRNVFNVLSCHPIFSINELDHVRFGCTHSAIILHHYIFESLDQSPRDIPSFCCLNSRIDQSFSTAHSVEVKLCRIKTLQIATLNKTLAFRSEIVFGKVRKRALIEPIRDSLSFDILLANTCHDLRNVNVASF